MNMLQGEKRQASLPYFVNMRNFLSFPLDNQPKKLHIYTIELQKHTFSCFPQPAKRKRRIIVKDWKTLYEVKGPKCLLELTATELKALMNEGADTVILSFGAIENHGSHLPLGADWFQANMLIRCVHEQLAAMGHKSVPGFPVPFGVQTNQFEREGANLFGNVPISERTFIDMTEDLCLSLHKQGFERFVLCLNHSENHAALHVAAKDLAVRFGLKCVVCDWVPPMNDFWPKVCKNAEHQGHGGEDEASCVLAAVPNLVHLEGCEPYYEEDDGKPVKMGGLHYYGGAVGIYVPVKEDKSPGYIGNPADAVAEEGFVCLEAYAKWIAEVADKYLFETELDEQD